MAFTLTRNFQVHFHCDRDGILPSYDVIIQGLIYSFYFGPCVILLKDHVI